MQAANDCPPSAECVIFDSNREKCGQTPESTTPTVSSTATSAANATNPATTFNNESAPAAVATCNGDVDPADCRDYDAKTVCNLDHPIITRLCPVMCGTCEATAQTQVSPTRPLASATGVKGTHATPRRTTKKVTAAAADPTQAPSDGGDAGGGVPLVAAMAAAAVGFVIAVGMAYACKRPTVSGERNGATGDGGPQVVISYQSQGVSGRARECTQRIALELQGEGIASLHGKAIFSEVRQTLGGVRVVAACTLHRQLCAINACVATRVSV